MPERKEALQFVPVHVLYVWSLGAVSEEMDKRAFHVSGYRALIRIDAFAPRGPYPFVGEIFVAPRTSQEADCMNVEVKPVRPCKDGLYRSKPCGNMGFPGFPVTQSLEGLHEGVEAFYKVKPALNCEREEHWPIGEPMLKRKFRKFWSISVEGL